MLYLSIYLCINLSIYLSIVGLEYLSQVFQVLSEQEEVYPLHEIEAASFLPYLINKMGDPKVREGGRFVVGSLDKMKPC